MSADESRYDEDVWPNVQSSAGFFTFWIIVGASYLGAVRQETDLAASLILLFACPVGLYLLTTWMEDRVGWVYFPHGVWYGVYSLIPVMMLLSVIALVAGL